MRQHSTLLLSASFLLLVMSMFFLPGKTIAQQTSISDFVIFGGSKAAGQTAPPAPGYAVQIASSCGIQGGSIGSYGLVKTTGNVTFTGNIFSGGTVQLANSNTVTGRITAANIPTVTTPAITIGSSANVGGNIDANGNIVVSGGTISGIVTHPTGTTYAGPAIGARNVTGTPSIPFLPSMPPIAIFPAVGTVNISTTQIIKPGSFGNVSLNGNKTLTLSGTGVYVFKSIKNSGTTNNFVFDFANDAVGTIKIYVEGDVDLNKVSATIINGGSESRVFAETHGSGSSCSSGPFAWNIANGSAGQGSKWVGSVWAPYAGINVGSGTGSTNIKGALWSGTQVNISSGLTIVFAPFLFCTPPGVNAGADKALDFLNPTTLTATSQNNSATFTWKPLGGGVITSAVNAASVTVSVAGTYVVTASSGGTCLSTDTVIVTGKNDSLIGSELKSIYENYNPNNPPSPFFTIQNDSILIDIIVKDGQYNTALAKFTAQPFGLTNIISNGESSYIITGLFPIKKLPLLNAETTLVVYVRPFYSAFGNSGVVASAGDTAMRTHLVRQGYQLDGAGVKVGVISDSYSTITAGTTSPKTNTAAQDVLNDDLPGIGNPNGNTTPVTVIKDYPFKRSDEGRGMLQIIHDVAPKADLYFRTGFISAGDFAAGIGELRQAGCNIIVDDVTYITEPFLKDGVIANAVDAAVAGGTTYFSAAGNFANKSYENSFNRSAVSGRAHDFGGGDTLQSVSLKAGNNYTIVLQWLDDIYSIGQVQNGGTKNDLDIYLTPDGKSLFGFNRNNTKGDPIEILPFTVTSDVTTNIMITNNTAGTNPARFKYIVFQGDIVINEYNTGTSTITGQANAQGAIAVGAVRYDRVPPSAVGPFAVESFSSIGGTVVNGQVRNKPDLVAPDGGNTTVNLGSDYPLSAQDGYTNFFGTSAAAPHAAAAAALIIEAKKKYANQSTVSPGELKSLLQSSATDMYTPGLDFISGAGFINPDSAIRTFAKPDPALIQLVVPPATTPGTAPFTVTVTGVNISPTSVVKFRDSALTTTFVNSGTATAEVPAFTGNPQISVYTPPVSSSGLDGGSSDSLKFFAIVKKNVVVTADKKTVKYGQLLPAFTATITVDGVPQQTAGISLTDLGLDSLRLTSSAMVGSDVGTYSIIASRVFDPKDPADIGFKELYNYSFNPGSISIEKLPVSLTAKDITITYGQKLPHVDFTYQFDGTNVPDSIALLNVIKSSHQSQLAKDAEGNDILGLVNGKAVTIVNGKAVPIVNGQAVTIVNGKAVTIVNGKAVPIVNGKAVTIVNGKAVTIVNNLTPEEMSDLSFTASAGSLLNARVIANRSLVNGAYVTDSTQVVDITQESILDFNNNSAQTYMLSSVTGASAKGLVDQESIANGKAVTIVNGEETTEIVNGQAVTIVNGKAVTIVNGKAVTIVNGQAVTIVNGKAVTIVNGTAVPIVNGTSKDAVIVDSSDIGEGVDGLKALNMVTGLDAGEQYVIPGSLTNNNLEIIYIPGKLNVLQAPVTITPSAGISKIYGDEDPEFKFTNNAALPDSEFTGTLGRVSGSDVGSYPYTLGTLSAGPNYILLLSAVTPVASFAITSKTVTITPTAGQNKVYGAANPAAYGYSSSISGVTFTGAISRSIGNNVGCYTYSIGNLSAGNNYNLVLSDAAPVATFCITKAALNIKADDKFINKGDALPLFTSVVTGVTNGDKVTITYSLSPVCAGNAGVYTIIPSIGSFANANNYNIVITNGTLYINPKGSYADDIDVYLDCIEDRGAAYLPANRRYIAHLYAKNSNSTTMYVPVGTDNKLSSTGSFDASRQPVIFAPGITKCDVPFDGVSLKWEVRTFEGSTKKLESVTVSSASKKCTTVAARSNTSLLPDLAARTQWGSGTAFPNPATGKVIINLAGSVLNIKALSLMDAYGKQHAVRLVRQITSSAAEIDLSGLARGVYFVKVKTENGFKTINIVKE